MGGSPSEVEGEGRGTKERKTQPGAHGWAFGWRVCYSGKEGERAT